MKILKPSQIAKTSESSHQCAFFAYNSLAAMYGFDAVDNWIENDIDLPPKPGLYAMPWLKWVHHIPNGGARGDSNDGTEAGKTQSRKTAQIRGGKLKAEGVKDGVHDVFVPIPVIVGIIQYHGFYIEFKKPSERPKTENSKGGMSNSQLEFKHHCKQFNYATVTVYDWQEAVFYYKNYLAYMPKQ